MLKQFCLIHQHFFDAVSALPERKKNDGSGRAAAAVADKFGVSVSTVYQARTVLKRGTSELIDALRNGDIPVKTAYKQHINNKENIMNLKGYEEISYLKDSVSLLKKIKNIEKIINEAGYTSSVNPSFEILKNIISFDIRVSFPFPNEKSEIKE